MGKYFGTDGFRGEANVNLTVEHAYKVGRFLGWFYGKNHEDGKAKIVIGKDTRRSSYMFEYSLVAGLTASGADAYLLHVTTTPSVSYVTRTEDFDCGIMISASHNPYYDNGIKLINDKGEKMREDVIGEIEKYLDGIPKYFIGQPTFRNRCGRHKIAERNGNAVFVFRDFRRTRLLRAFMADIQTGRFPLCIARRHEISTVIVRRCPPEVWFRDCLDHLFSRIFVGNQPTV